MTLFSAPNYCGEFDNAGAMMSVDETLMCSFQILKVRHGGRERDGGDEGGKGRKGWRDCRNKEGEGKKEGRRVLGVLDGKLGWVMYEV